MDKMAHIVGEKVGDAVEGAIKQSLGIKDKKKEKTKGGGLFGCIRKDTGTKDEKKGGFFSNMFHKSDHDKSSAKASGFTGLFAEPGVAGAAGESDGEECEYNPAEENAKQSEGAGGDLNDDLLEVASEMSTGH